MGSVYGPNMVTDGLLFYIDAGNAQSYPGSGTTWYDLSGKGNNATLVNGPSLDTTAGIKSLNFDGSNDYAIWSGVTSTILAPAGAVSMEAWFKLDSTVDQMMLFDTSGSANTSSYRDFFSIRCNWTAASPPLTTAYYNGSSSISTYFTNAVSETAATAGWCNVSYVVDVNATNKQVLYEFGQQTGTNTSSGGTFNTNIDQILFASDNYLGPTSYGMMDGKIAMFKIYNRALTAAEILQNYNAHKSRFGL